VFETPKGPFAGAPIGSSVAIYPGVAGPSWAYLRPFVEEVKRLEKAPQFSPSDLLRQVVTDAHFNQVINTVDRQGNLVTDRQGLLKARTNAWALAFYLMKYRLPGMMRYFEELAALPRDLEVDDKTLLACFARAFDVANATQDGIDPAKFEQLAKDWVSNVKGQPIPGAEFGLGSGETGNQGTPGAPAGPGGPGGRPGGGRPGGGGGGRGDA